MDAFERLLWWLFALSAGAQTRGSIALALKERPDNAQQLSQRLGLDYSTIRHHLGVMEKNRIVVSEGEKYGKVYFLSESLEAHWQQFEAILAKSGRENSRRTKRIE